jgi:hypothetical protein
MVASIVGLIPLAIWASKPDFKEIRRIIKEWKKLFNMEREL